MPIMTVSNNSSEKKSASIQISIFFRGVFCPGGRPGKNRTNELVCYIEPDAARSQSSDWDKLLRPVTIVT